MGGPLNRCTTAKLDNRSLGARLRYGSGVSFEADVIGSKIEQSSPLKRHSRSKVGVLRLVESKRFAHRSDAPHDPCCRGRDNCQNMSAMSFA